MFYPELLESGYVRKDGLQSAVRGVYLQNKLLFQVCTGSDWVTVKNYLLVLKCQWIQLRNYFFYKIIMVSKKKGKYGVTCLDCWVSLREGQVPSARLYKSSIPVQNSYIPEKMAWLALGSSWSSLPWPLSFLNFNFMNAATLLGEEMGAEIIKKKKINKKTSKTLAQFQYHKDLLTMVKKKYKPAAKSFHIITYSCFRISDI